MKTHNPFLNQSQSKGAKYSVPYESCTIGTCSYNVVDFAKGLNTVKAIGPMTFDYMP